MNCMSSRNLSHILITVFVSTLISFPNPVISENSILNSESLYRVFKIERELFKVLQERQKQLQDSLELIKEYTRDVESLYRNEGCWPLESCIESKIFEQIVGNPIYNYQVLRRLIVNWKNTEDSLKKIDIKQIMTDIKRLKKRNGGLPDGKDLQTAAKALNRIHKIYDINTTEFSNGNILGHQTSANLGLRDTLYLGRFAANTDYPGVALNWLNTAQSQANLHPNSSEEALKQVKLALRQVNRKLSKKPKSMGDKDPYILGAIPDKTEDPNLVISNTDRRNFEALCRGEKLISSFEESKLYCYYDDRGVFGLKLSPLKVEINHREPHLILTFHDLFTQSETHDLIESVKSDLTSAGVGTDKTISDMRISSHVWIPDGMLSIVDKISEKIENVIGLRSMAQLDPEAKKEEYEMLQVANYGLGGHYDCHHDSMFIYKEPQFIPKSVEETQSPYITGDRMSTFMIYLSDVQKGGNTAFPRLGVATSPRKGSAVFWHNIKRSGRSDMHMIHGACPVVMGSKWVANKWIREVANIFRRPCIKDIDH
ncbi:prolyl 4-hydroxylase subunit alpha-2 [Lepeophtheirus salmonis]|uniref:prolyl 4-hydroxylase subunit alpha-2 n=1 Tax=Lepeophtheirus salmonis TaxID=72036 RepID=UPI001AE3FC08|nr:prolyl 4-hydroxylase subunit alpha-2-like [Lepeophtheirus salmonis]